VFLFREAPTPAHGEQDQKKPHFATQKPAGGTYTATLPRSAQAPATQQDLEAPSIAEARRGDRLPELSEDRNLFARVLV